jgi:hypothetical protein
LERSALIRVGLARELISQPMTGDCHVGLGRYIFDYRAGRRRIAGVAMEAAKLVFFVAIVLFAIAALVGLVRGRTPTVP